MIPASVRFQVSIPTAVALAAGFFEMSELAMAEPIIEAALAREVAAIAAAVPHDRLAVQWDPGHKHIIEPKDLGTCVAYANAITAGSPRSVDFIHTPLPRDRPHDAYFAPLVGLDVPDDVQLFMGLVHHTDGIDGTRDRLDTAVAHAGRDIGIATECGFGRRDPATIPGLLRIHVDTSR